MFDDFEDDYSNEYYYDYDDEEADDLPNRKPYIPEFHGFEPEDYAVQYEPEYYEEPQRPKLAPKEIIPDGQKLKIPEGKAKPLFISPEEDARLKEIESKRHLKEGVVYGEPYEHHKKSHKESAHKGIEPRNPTAERKTPVG